MAPQLPSQSLDDELVANIAQILDEAGVPSILWGNYLLTVLGVPTVVEVGSLQSRPYDVILNYARTSRLSSTMI